MHVATAAVRDVYGVDGAAVHRFARSSLNTWYRVEHGDEVLALRVGTGSRTHVVAVAAPGTPVAGVHVPNAAQLRRLLGEPA